MSGPRVTSGEDSKQDYRTPEVFMSALVRRFGPVAFDLAAHSGNAQHARYFAPPDSADSKAYALDAFAHSWSALSRMFPRPDRPLAYANPGAGLLWLNPPFDNIGRWAERCQEEAATGAHIALLTPAVFTNWFRDFGQGRADTYFLHGRLSFDGRNAYPKDCMLNLFSPYSQGVVSVWDWKTDAMLAEGTWSHRPSKI